MDCLDPRYLEDYGFGMPEVLAGASLDANQLTVLRDVAIMKAGVEYELSTGKTTFTPEDLADVVASQDDPAVSAPRLKIGHVDPRFDGEPALGKATNLRLVDAGTTVKGDYIGVPKWLAGIMASAYPNCSIEGNWNVETNTGNKWRLVVTAVSLLGIHWPGISTLEDLPVIFSEEGPEGVTVEKVAAAPSIQAAVNAEDVRREYYDSLGSAESWWWIRAIYLDPNELIVDDDEGQLYRVPFTISGDDVTFGDPQEVKIVYEDVPQKAAARLAVSGMNLARGERVAASFDSRADARPLVAARQEGDEGMDPEVRKALGLEPDASDEDVLKAVNALKAEQPDDKPDDKPAPTVPQQPAEPSVPGGTPDKPDEQSQPSGEETDITKLAASKGLRVVDNDTFETLKRGAEAGIAVAAQQATEKKESVLASAVKEGKIPPARKDHWSKLYDADPEGTTQTLAGLAGGVVPLMERGHADAGDFATEDAYPDNWFPEVAARKRTAAANEGQKGTGRVLQERVS